jgi:hypothetical protein
LTHAVWVAASLLFILFGVSTRSLDLPARLAVRFATGIVIGGTVMYCEALVDIPWTRLSLAIPMLIWSAVAMRPLFAPAPKSGGMAAALQIAPIVILAIYGVATARETSGDLLYFWGPKGQRFFFAQTIDIQFLKFPHYYLMHPDYPPLQPLVYAWNSIAAHRFSYWGATLLTPLYLLASVLAFRGFAQQKISARNANAYATLLAALLAFGFAAGQVAGGADAQLVMFAVIALSALTFADGHIVAAIALAGAAFTKVEGAAFAAVVIVAYTLVRRDWRRSLVLAAPPAILLGSWIVFAQQHGLLDAYARGRTTLHFDQLGLVLYVADFEARYRAMYLPWIAVVAPFAFARNWRAAALPLIVAVAAILYTIFFYLHEANAVWWIKASAERVLLTPLAALLVATAAASE